jgi:hypothetical protein
LFDHSPYSPGLAPSDYHQFQSQCFKNNEELMEGVKTWLKPQAADFFDSRHTKLLRRYDYVEK